MLHAGGPNPGGYRYLEIWTSRDEAMSFHNTHVRQELTEVGLDRSQLDVQITEIERVTTLVAGDGVTMPTLAEIGQRINNTRSPIKRQGLERPLLLIG